MKCEWCGEEADIVYGSGRFCSARCARLFSISFCDPNEIKISICKKCGKEVQVKKHDRRVTLCSECRKNPCKICGRIDCDSQICKHHNINRTLKSLNKYFELDISKKGTVEIFDEIHKIEQKLRNLYYDNKLSTVEIAKLYKCPTHIITDTFKNYGITLRGSSEAVSLSFLEGRNNQPTSQTQYKTEWHKTWDGREVFLRSSYETDYANELDSEKIYYEVENLKVKYFDTQQNEYRCAIPDFYIPYTNTIVEIKSNYTLNLQNMKDKFQAYQKLGYSTKLILDHKEVDIETLNFTPTKATNF